MDIYKNIYIRFGKDQYIEGKMQREKGRLIKFTWETSSFVHEHLQLLLPLVVQQGQPITQVRSGQVWSFVSTVANQHLKPNSFQFYTL